MLEISTHASAIFSRYVRSKPIRIFPRARRGIEREASKCESSHRAFPMPRDCGAGKTSSSAKVVKINDSVQWTVGRQTSIWLRHGGKLFIDTGIADQASEPGNFWWRKPRGHKVHHPDPWPCRSHRRDRLLERTRYTKSRSANYVELVNYVSRLELFCPRTRRRSTVPLARVGARGPETSGKIDPTICSMTSNKFL